MSVYEMISTTIIISVCLLLGVADGTTPEQCKKYDFQLVNGNETAGEVQMCHEGTWKHICDDRWTDTNAKVVCRLMGLPYFYSTMTIESHFGGDIYPDDVEIVLDDVRCYGNESRLIDCFHAGLGLENCNGNELAGVVCKGPPPCTEGEQGDIRLVGGNELEGIVEICYRYDQSRRNVASGTIIYFWGLICDDHWDIEETTVACRQLGFTYNDPRSFSCARRRYPTVDNLFFWLDEVNCSGNENRLLECGHQAFGDNDCNPDEVVGIRCDAIEPMPSPSPTPTQPIIDTCEEIEGQVYTTDCNCLVCGEQKTCEEEDCKPGCYCPLGTSLDKEKKKCVEKCPDIPSPSPVLCPIPGQNYTTCACETVCFEEPPSCSVCEPGCQCPPGTRLDRSARECVAVCRDPNECITNGTIRLVGGDSTQGDVEICYSRVWKPVCDDYWTSKEARVVCGRLGFQREDAKGTTHSKFGSDRAPVDYWLDDVDCSGNEDSLFDCEHKRIGQHNCRVGERAGAICVAPERVRRHGSDNHTATPGSGSASGTFPTDEVTEAIAYINGSGIIGYITFSLVEPNRVYVFVFLSGLSAGEKYDWHIHIYGINNNLPEHMRCHSAGPHYDPDNIFINSCNYEKDCNSDIDSVQYCEAGDLTGRLGHIPGTGQLNAITEVDFEDIIGRSVVIHNTDGTRVACGNIEPFVGESIQ